MDTWRSLMVALDRPDTMQDYISNIIYWQSQKERFGIALRYSKPLLETSSYTSSIRSRIVNDLVRTYLGYDIFEGLRDSKTSIGPCHV